MVLPNQLTVLRIILTPVFVYFFLSGKPLHSEISLAVFLVAALTDWYDGWLARKFNYITSWGKFMDPMADKILTAGASLSLCYVGVFSWWMIILILSRDFLVTGFRGLADYKGLSFPTSRYAKWKTAIQMVFLYYVLVLYIAGKNEWIAAQYGNWILVALHPGFVYYMLLLITVITLHSGYLYIYENRKIIPGLWRQ